MSYETIETRVEAGKVGIITLNRPKALNALNDQLMTELGQALKAYDAELIHHHRLSKAAVEEVFRELATETIAQRLDEPGMEAERADVIVGGCCILVAIMRYFAFETCLVSESDILNGLVASLRD